METKPVNSKTGYGLWITETRESQLLLQRRDTENCPFLLLYSISILLKMIRPLSAGHLNYTLNDFL